MILKVVYDHNYFYARLAADSGDGTHTWREEKCPNGHNYQANAILLQTRCGAPPGEWIYRVNQELHVEPM